MTVLTGTPSQILIVPAGEELVEDLLFSRDPRRRCSRRKFFSDAMEIVKKHMLMVPLPLGLKKTSLQH